MFVSIGQASTLIGVAVSTLRRWEKEERFSCSFRTKGGHRRYQMSEIQRHFWGQKTASSPRKNIGYARVSSTDQRGDLARQVQRLEKYCLSREIPCEVVSDLGSGLNYRKKGLNYLIQEICSANVATLLLTHKDRLLRFGSPLIFKLCEFFGTQVLILDEEKEKNFETELVGDVIELMTVFCSRIYGKRAHKNKKAA